MSKCIKCGRELTSSEIPEFNNGMCDKCYKDYQCEQYPFKRGIYDMQNEIKQLKQQLAEKDKEIAHLKEKDNYHLRYELAGADETITNLKQQLEEKDKEIEKLKQQNTILENENGKLTTELIMGKYKKAQKEVSFGKQLAIQELEKVKKRLLEESKRYPIVYDITDDLVGGAIDKDKTFEIIDNQINELKKG